jgi:hypothetical protein
MVGRVVLNAPRTWFGNHNFRKPMIGTADAIMFGIVRLAGTASPTLIEALMAGKMGSFLDNLFSQSTG